MKNTKHLLITLFALAALLLGAYFLYDALSARAVPGENASAAPSQTASPSASSENAASEKKESVPAPDFTVLDAAGNRVTLSSRFGKPLVLNFWASWCGPCQKEMPDFEALAAEFGDTVTFMMVNLTDGRRETQASAKAFITEHGYSFPVYFDTEDEGASAYGVRSIPTTFFIDAEGGVRSYYPGTISEELLRRGIAELSE